MPPQPSPFVALAPCPVKPASAPAGRLDAPLQIGRLRLRNRVFAAPLSGVSDLPFRRLTWAGGAGLTVSEMAASGVMAAETASRSGRAESLRRLQSDSAGDWAAQLVGRAPQLMAAAAKIAAANGAAMIDINMGCPAKKLAGKAGTEACGAALMRDESLAAQIIEAVAAAVSLPVSVKMRLGWDENTINAPRLAQLAEQAGAQMIIVHARTRSQFYQGRADWALARAVREKITVPLIINGDIDSRETAEQAMALSGADGVMIGRAAYGRPWLPGTLAGHKPPADIPAYILAHYRAMLEHYGAARGLRHARKHLDWYLQRLAAGLWTAAERAELLASLDPAFVEARLAAIFARR